MPSKILLIDDEVNITTMAGEALKQQGYEVVTASDGASGLKTAIAEKPDLIVLDRNMPGMDGIEVCRKIRETESLMGVPVIFVTAKDEKREILDGLAEGANDYITKPFNIEELKESVKNLLSKKKNFS